MLNQLPDVQDWPVMDDGTPYLCMVRTIDNTREHGFLIHGSWEINIGYVWDGGTGDTYQYKNPEELLKAKWEVD